MKSFVLWQNLSRPAAIKSEFLVTPTAPLLRGGFFIVCQGMGYSPLTVHGKTLILKTVQ